jgi:hypothetical protein
MKNKQTRQSTMSDQNADPETLKKAQLYQLIEELVLSEHARYRDEEPAAASGHKGQVVKNPAGHSR